MVVINWFPLIQLPRKSEVVLDNSVMFDRGQFPLIQLPRKSEVILQGPCLEKFPLVSINSTSEEVRSGSHHPAGFRTPRAGFH